MGFCWKNKKHIKMKKENYSQFKEENVRSIRALDHIIDGLIACCSYRAEHFPPNDKITNIYKEQLNDYIRIRSNYEKLGHYYKEMFEEP